MGPLRNMERACLLLGVLCKDDDALTHYMKGVKDFGEALIISQVIAFDFTEYYTADMGSPLVRRFYLYPPGFDPASLPEIKLRTNAMETEAARTLDLGVSRPLNLDPGYLTLSKVILASTKDHMHRIYLRDGIYAECTLYYQHKTYRPWPWTFPDYASDTYIRFFNEIRVQALRT
ncbi:MAG: DUF4416 family protein [Planctomycetes bacterium]|nr:DUF4416 family protein [Planctomycetota bacterium]